MEPHSSFRHFGPNPSKGRPHTKSYVGVEDRQSSSLLPVPSYVPCTSSSRVPQIAEGGWQPTPRIAPSLPISSKGLHGLSLAPHPVASGRDTGIVAVTEEWGDQPSWKTAPDLPLMPSSFGFFVAGHDSYSTQQVGQKSHTRQHQIETHRSHSFDNSKQYAALTALHPIANTTAVPADLKNTIQETDQVVCGQTMTVIDDWLPPFNEWLPTRQQQMSVQGLGDPLLCRSVWAQVFGEWLQLRRFLSSQSFVDLVDLPCCWNDIFDCWLQHLLKPDARGFDAFHATSAHTNLSTSLSVVSTPPHTQDVTSLYHTSTTLKGRSRIPNAVSRFTLQEIQEACRKNGVEESIIARIAVVFPDVVSRDHLMLARRSGGSAGDQRDHQGYMEFAGRCMVNLENIKRRRTGGTNVGQVQRYYCKLCGPPQRPRWKNSKDLLGHVWNTHCDL